MKKLINISLALSLLLFASCADWLDVKPSNETREEELFSTGVGCETALNGIYQLLSQESLYGKELTWGFLSAASECYTLDGLTSEFVDAARHQYNTTNTQPVVEAIWDDMYTAIAHCNNLIQHVEKADPEIFDLKELEKNVILGEGYALRGMIHFELARLFAPAPKVAGSGNYLPYNEVHPTLVGKPIPLKEFLDKAINDLKKGRDLVATMDTLPEYNYYYTQLAYRIEQGGSGVTPFFNYRSTRLNYLNICCILARVYLYAGYTEEALETALVIDSQLDNNYSFDNAYKFPSYYESQSTDTRDFKSHSDIFFALFNNDESSIVLPYYGGLYGFIPLRTDMFSGLEDDDVRYKFLTAVNDGKRYSLKMHQSGDDWAARTYHPLLPNFRRAELYYIIAECLFPTDPETALVYLNAVRYYRQIYTDLTLPMDEAEFLRELRADASREWVGEGQMFFMNKRHNVTTTDQGVFIPDKGEVNYVLPIPASNTVQ